LSATSSTTELRALGAALGGAEAAVVAATAAGEDD
jgi:hypothetical protein